MMQPWMHAPLAHQMAFHAKFGAAPATPMIPAGAGNGQLAGAMVPNAVSSPAIHEKVQPKRIKTFVHSGVQSPGMGGAQQNGAMGGSPGLGDL